MVNHTKKVDIKQTTTKISGNSTTLLREDTDQTTLQNTALLPLKTVYIKTLTKYTSTETRRNVTIIFLNVTL